MEVRRKIYMTGHFVTACGCESYKLIDYPPAHYCKLPMKAHTKAAVQPASGWVTHYGSRGFELVSVDINKALAEYEEVQ